MKKAIYLGLAIACSIITASLFVPVSTIAAAQQPAAQVCPVSFKVEGGAFGDHVHLKNLAAQPITGILFHSQRLNAVGEEVSATSDEARAKASFGIPDHSEQTFSDRKGLAPNADGHMNDNMVFYGQRQKGDQFVTYIRAVRFADGTTWKDDGSHSCRNHQ